MVWFGVSKLTKILGGGSFVEGENMSLFILGCCHIDLVVDPVHPKVCQ